MANKFDQHKTKHQLCHISISLGTFLVCMMYMKWSSNWQHLGSFWNSWIIPLVLAGEIMKLLLVRYYGYLGDGVLTHKQRLKKANYFTQREMTGSLVVQILSTLLYAFMCIILGAPVFNNWERTCMLAILLTLLTVSLTVFLLGGGGALQFCFYKNPKFVTKSEATALELCTYNALGGVLGAWAGSVVTPLDWDREWQVYPIPNVVGALLGSALGNIYAGSRVLYATAEFYINNEHF